MKMVNISGSLLFDHLTETLSVKINNSGLRGESKRIKSLSGGEHSFVTVGFLLSLWTVAESPVLFLDEFDVYLDKANRDRAYSLIMSAAQKSLREQYVFLSPEEVPIKQNEFVKFYKLDDPVRHKKCGQSESGIESQEEMDEE